VSRFKVYELTPDYFDGSTDAVDHEIVWVAAEKPPIVKGFYTTEIGIPLSSPGVDYVIEESHYDGKMTVTFDDCSEGEYNTIKDAEDAILEAHADGVAVDYITDEDENLYSCEWSVKISKES